MEMPFHSHVTTCRYWESVNKCIQIHALFIEAGFKCIYFIYYSSLTAGRFTFQVQLHREAGKIVFAYKKVCYYPLMVQAHAFSR